MEDTGIVTEQSVSGTDPDNEKYANTTDSHGKVEMRNKTIFIL